MEKINHAFDDVWRQIAGAAESRSDNETEKHFLESLVRGGITAASIVVSCCDGLAKYCSPFNTDKALGLTRLYSWIMLCQCYRWLQGELNPESNPIPIGEFGEKLLSLFGKMDEGEYQLYLNLNTQFNYDLDKKPHMTHFSALLLALSSEVCGHKCLDWTTLRFPVKEMTHIFLRGGVIDTEPMRSLNVTEAVKEALGTGIQAMEQ